MPDRDTLTQHPQASASPGQVLSEKTRLRSVFQGTERSSGRTSSRAARRSRIRSRCQSGTGISPGATLSPKLDHELDALLGRKIECLSLDLGFGQHRRSIPVSFDRRDVESGRRPDQRHRHVPHGRRSVRGRRRRSRARPARHRRHRLQRRRCRRALARTSVGNECMTSWSRPRMTTEFGKRCTSRTWTARCFAVTGRSRPTRRQ